MAKLPEHDGGPGFTRRRLAADKGAGTEIVLELDHPEQVSALHDHCQAHWTVAEALQVRPCGLSDFRVSDPDGYYLRVAHGNAATPEQPPSSTLHHAEQALTAAKLHLVQQLHTRNLPAADHATSTTGWLREHLHISSFAARRLVGTGGVSDNLPPWAGGHGSGDNMRDGRTPGQRRADALTDVCRLALNTGELPVNGGDRPPLTLTVPYDLLRRQLGAATLDTGNASAPPTPAASPATPTSCRRRRLDRPPRHRPPTRIPPTTPPRPPPTPRRNTYHQRT